MSEWSPEPAQLRDGETVDVDAHARRNLEQIRRGVADGLLDPAELSAERRQQLSRLR